MIDIMAKLVKKPHGEIERRIAAYDPTLEPLMYRAHRRGMMPDPTA
jgi:hypothetical protein